MNNHSLKERAHGEIERIFRILLPQNGLAVREEQITLCHAMLDTLLKNNIALCDAGVGIGKTCAYLTACILLKKFAPHGPAGSQPVVVSTSSVALQDAIIGEYISFLPRIFLENRIIQKPLRAMVRKGKERFVCDVRLAGRLEAVKDKKKNAQQMKALLSLRVYYDLDAVTGLSGFDRRQVCVPKVCEKTCPLRNACRYHQYLKEARSAEIFVQICNHNYLLADTAKESTERAVRRIPQVQIIEPTIRPQEQKVRVCAYAHVSSDPADQLSSFSAQVEYFTQLIQAHSDWKIIDIYADEGITGTRADKHDDFQQMMRDCRAGRIDCILVKSISRFARNSTDCIKAVRELQALGISVTFEEEQINTGTLTNEVILSMTAPLRKRNLSL